MISSRRTLAVWIMSGVLAADLISSAGRLFYCTVVPAPHSASFCAGKKATIAELAAMAAVLMGTWSQRPPGRSEVYPVPSHP